MPCPGRTPSPSAAPAATERISSSAYRVGNPPPTEGPNKGITIDYETLNKDFAEAMAWDLKSGVPSSERLAALGIGDVATALAR